MVGITINKETAKTEYQEHVFKLQQMLSSAKPLQYRGLHCTA